MVLHVYLTHFPPRPPAHHTHTQSQLHTTSPTHTATASYRLLPEIILTQPVTGANAKKLAKCFAKGVIKVVTREDGKSHAEVVDPRKDTCSREVLRHEVN